MIWYNSYCALLNTFLQMPFHVVSGTERFATLGTSCFSRFIMRTQVCGHVWWCDILLTNVALFSRSPDGQVWHVHLSSCGGQKLWDSLLHRTCTVWPVKYIDTYRNKNLTGFQRYLFISTRLIYSQTWWHTGSGNEFNANWPSHVSARDSWQTLRSWIEPRKFRTCVVHFARVSGHGGRL